MKSGVINLIAVSVTLIAFVAVTSFYRATINPAYYLSTHESQFASISLECNIAIASATESGGNTDETKTSSLITANHVSLVACHDLDVLAAKMLGRGVNLYRLREIYLNSLENEQLPLWMLSEPPRFRWERQ